MHDPVEIPFNVNFILSFLNRNREG